MLSFLDNDKFSDLEEFLLNYENLKTKEQIDELHKLIQPFLLRRTKIQAEKDLPPRSETIIEVELTTIQKQWYKAIYEKNAEFLQRAANYADNKAKKTEFVNLNNIAMELRKV